MSAIVLDLWVDGIPMTKGSWRIARGKLIPDNEGEPAWAEAIGWAARAKLRNAEPTKDRFAVRCEFTLPPRAGRKSYNRDGDKLLRSVFDALTGIVWADDEQVDAAQFVKMRGDVPGARITIERLT